MSPPMNEKHLTPAGVPRASGDEPVLVGAEANAAQCSPREWGCASTGWTFSREKLMFPA